MMTEEEIRETAVVTINKQQLFHSNNVVPVRGGLFSPEMGHVDRYQKGVCPTDGQLSDKSPGYQGVLELVKPVPWFQHVKRIKQTLFHVCYRCAKLLVAEHATLLEVLHAMEIGERLKRLKRARTSICPACRTPQPKKIDEISSAEEIIGACNLLQSYSSSSVFTSEESISAEAVSALTLAMRKKDKKDRNLVLYVLNFGDERRIVVDFEYVYSLISRISVADGILLGFDMARAKPRAMGCKALPISSPIIRASILQENGQRSEDDQTSIYYLIIQVNEELKTLLHSYDTMRSTAIELRREMAYTIYEKWSYLAFLVASLYTSKIPGYAPLQQRTGRPFTNVKMRIDGKYGRFRCNLSGKRTSHCARTVIIGSPLNRINEVTIPLEMAMGLTITETVTIGNIECLQKTVDQGPDQYPGARHVQFKSEGYIMRAILPGRQRPLPRLRPGDKVSRHLIGGDPVLTNRQPSMYKGSMEGNEARISRHGLPLQISLQVVENYHADFDGDEMNLHVNQNSMSRAETRYPAGAAQHIISPTNATVSIAPHQDAVLAMHLFTENGKTVSVRQAMMITQHVFSMNAVELFRDPDDPEGKRLLPLHARISTRKLLSLVFPSNFQFLLHTSNGGLGISEEDKVVQITDGQFVSGRLNKSVMNASTRGIIHRLVNDYGPFTCMTVMNQIHDMMREFMMVHSFSLDASDFVCPEEASRQIQQLMEETNRECETLIQKVYDREFVNNTLETAYDKLELELNNILNRAGMKVGKTISDTIGLKHNILTVIRSMSKGNMANLVQLLACFGQQNMNGMRMPLDRNGIVLPYYQKYEFQPEARGFIENSYTQGLNPIHQIHTGLGGRQVCVESSENTPHAGYLQRRIVKGDEALAVKYDRTVRYVNKRISQWAYGDNHVSPERLESVPLEFLVKSRVQLQTYFLDTPSDKFKVSAGQYAKFQDFQDQACQYILQTREEYFQVLTNVDCGNDRYLTHGPVAFAQLLASYRCHDRARQRANQQSSHVADIQQVVWEMYEICFGKKQLRRAAPGRLFRSCYFYYLNPLILEQKGFTVEDTRAFITNIQVIYLRSLVHVGTLVGVIAGQSCASANTQSALDASKKANGETKHSSYRVTGMARLEELLVLKQDPGSPCMTIFPSYVNTADSTAHLSSVESLRVSLKHCVLYDLVNECSILYAPYTNEMVASIQARECEDPYDPYLMYRYASYCRQMRTTNGSLLQQHNLFPYILRLVLDQEQMYRHKVTTQEIVGILKRVYQDNIDCVYSTMTDPQLVIRISLQNSFMLKRSGVNKKDADKMSMTTIYETLQTFQRTLLKNTTIKGVTGILDVSSRNATVWRKVRGDYQQVNTQVVETFGSNLRKVLSLPGVDATRTYSNHVYEVYQVLGKMACRAILIQELKKVLPTTNYSNISTVVDKMLYLASPCVINRSGIRNDSISTITKASFETQTECLIHGARQGKMCALDSPTMSVITAQRGSYGTNVCTIRMNVLDPLITKAWSRIRTVADEKMRMLGLDDSTSSPQQPMEEEEVKEGEGEEKKNEPTPLSMVERIYLQSAMETEPDSSSSLAMEIEME
jgi:DNA-directed RNA polymerase II subunit RPB1